MCDAESSLHLWVCVQTVAKEYRRNDRKKKGTRWIHTLRLIKLIEADFNSALKHFFSKDLMIAVETNDTLVDEQWGIQKNRTSTDASMLKLLTFECARIKKSTYWRRKL